jgi:O-antigen/teichoic acid export membrane protein
MIRRVAAGIGMTAFDKLVVAGTQLALVPVLAMHWGLALYGQWLLLATVPQFLSMSDFGFATAAGTRMTMAAARGDRDEAVRVFQSAWRAILASSAVMVCLGLIVAWSVPARLFGTEPAAPVADLRLTLAVLAIYGVVAVQGSIVFAGFRAARLFALGAFWNAIVLLVENAALIVTVMLGGGTVAAASAWLGGRMLGLAGQNLLLRRRVPWLTIGLARGTWAEARRLLAPAGSVMLLPIAQAVVLQGMALVVGAVAGRAAVPAFAATRTLSRVSMQMCWIVSTPLMPEFSAALAQGDRRRMAAMITATLLFSALVVVPFALAFMVLGRGAIAFWTHGAIVPQVGLVAAMALAILFGGIWYPLSNLILAANAHAGYTIWYLGLAGAAVATAAWLVGPLGATGAAAAMAALDLAMLVVVIRLGRRLFGAGLDLPATVSLLRRRLARGLAFTREAAPR